jgi:hypothetical protein
MLYVVSYHLYMRMCSGYRSFFSMNKTIDVCDLVKKLSLVIDSRDKCGLVIEDINARINTSNPELSYDNSQLIILTEFNSLSGDTRTKALAMIIQLYKERHNISREHMITVE